MGVCDICDVISIKQLQGILKSHGLPISGTKNVLIARLYEYSREGKIHGGGSKGKEPNVIFAGAKKKAAGAGVKVAGKGAGVSKAAAKRGSKQPLSETFIFQYESPNEEFVIGNTRVHVSERNIKIYLGRKLAAAIHNYIGYWIDQYILVKINAHEYLYIGPIVYIFKTKDEIVHYTTWDGMYPISFGTTNVYFMLDQEYMPRSEIWSDIYEDNTPELYAEFYGHLYPNKRTRPHKMSGLRDIAFHKQ